MATIKARLVPISKITNSFRFLTLIRRRKSSHGSCWPTINHQALLKLTDMHQIRSLDWHDNCCANSTPEQKNLNEQRNVATSFSPLTSPTLAINEQVPAMWANGEGVFHLGFGESRMPLHSRLVSALRDRACEKSYLEAAGLKELHEEIASFYDRKWNLKYEADQIIMGLRQQSFAVWHHVWFGM